MAKEEEKQTWKHETAREERRERLSRLKGTDGSKKQIKTKSKVKKVLSIILILILVLGLGIWVVAGSNVMQKRLTAIDVSGNKVSPAEFNFNFGLYATQALQAPAFSEQGLKALDNPSRQDPKLSMRDMLVDMVINQMKVVYGAINEYKADKNFKFTEEQNKNIESQVDKMVEQLQNSAKQQDKSLEKFIFEMFGPGNDISTIKNFVRKQAEVNEYANQKQKDLKISADRIAEYKKQNKSEYMLYTYKLHVFSATLPSDATDQVRKKAAEDVKHKAESVVAIYQKNKDFVKAVLEYETESTVKEKIRLNPNELNKKDSASRLPFDAVKWLSDKARKAGDITYIMNGSNAFVMIFEKAEDDNSKAFDVRHILITPQSIKEEAAKSKGKKTEGNAQTTAPQNTTKAAVNTTKTASAANNTSVTSANGAAKGEAAPSTEELWAAAKKKAGEIVAEYNAGSKTAEAFAKLVEKYSADTGSVGNGGLYENVSLRSQMVDEFKNWGVEKDRKPGDVGIIKTTYGYHIMFFVKYADKNAADTDIEEKLKNKDMQDWVKKISEKTEVKRNNFGLKFVARPAFFDALFAKAPVDPAALKAKNTSTTTSVAANAASKGTKDTTVVTKAKEGAVTTTVPTTKAK